MTSFILLILLLLTGLGILLGLLAAKLSRKHRLKGALSKKPVIAHYDLVYRLNPIEFEAICTGRVTVNGLAGFIAWAIMNGRAIVSEHSITFVGISSNERRLFEALLPSSALNHTTPLVLDSLTRQGWLRDLSQSSNRHTLKRSSAIAACVAAVSLILGTAGIFNIVLGNEQTGLALAVIGAAGFAVALIWATSIHVGVEHFVKNTQITSRISPTYLERYHNIYGVYHYMLVSGMDIMTPDYSTLNMRGLDDLYPYAVAAGLDKKLTEELRNYKIINN